MNDADPNATARFVASTLPDGNAVSRVFATIATRVGLLYALFEGAEFAAERERQDRSHQRGIGFRSTPEFSRRLLALRDRLRPKTTRSCLNMVRIGYEPMKLTRRAISTDTSNSFGHVGIKVSA
jgi:hypothetical protein